MSALQKIILVDGRTLAYAEYGPPMGKALIYCHGLPGSHLESPPDHSLLDKYHVRLIIPDRPGYGGSDFLPKRTMLDFASDVEQLADALGLDDFSVLGFSGGGPYAQVLALRLADRVRRLLLISSSAPHDVDVVREALSPASQGMFTLAASDPQTLENQLAAAIGSGEALLAMMESLLSEPDKKLFQQPEFRSMYSRNMSMAIAQGLTGVVWDMHLAAIPWGFDPGEISCPNQLWHGECDNNVPPVIGHYLANVIVGCNSHFLSNEGHYLMFNHWQEILRHAFD